MCYYNTWQMILAMVFRPFAFLPPQDFKIIWLYNHSTMSVPDEGIPDKRCAHQIGYTRLFLVILHVIILHRTWYIERTLLRNDIKLIPPFFNEELFIVQSDGAMSID